MMPLKKTDIKLLSDAMKSNGGGVREAAYPRASVARMMDAALIQRKPNSRTLFCGLLTITALGKFVLSDAQKGGA